MTALYTLYGAQNSRSTRIAWILEELGVPWQWCPISFRKGDHRAPAFQALNPAGKVPVLVHGDVVLTESAAIARYLCARHPEAGLLPASGTPAGAKVDQWLFFDLSELEQTLWLKAKYNFALPEKLRVPDVRATADYEFARAARIAGVLFGEGPYAAGDHFTVADVFVAHTCAWADAATRWDDLPESLQLYARKVLSRPARLRAMERERQDS